MAAILSRQYHPKLAAILKNMQKVIVYPFANCLVNINHANELAAQFRFCMPVCIFKIRLEKSTTTTVLNDQLSGSLQDTLVWHMRQLQVPDQLHYWPGGPLQGPISLRLKMWWILKFLTLRKMHILLCMGSNFCVQFQMALKFHTKFWTHTSQNMHFTDLFFFVTDYILVLWRHKPYWDGPQITKSNMALQSTEARCFTMFNGDVWHSCAIGFFL